MKALNSLRNLIHGLRPGVECAEWVIERLRRIESELVAHEGDVPEAPGPLTVSHTRDQVLEALAECLPTLRLSEANAVVARLGFPPLGSGVKS